MAPGVGGACCAATFADPNDDAQATAKPAKRLLANENPENFLDNNQAK